MIVINRKDAFDYLQAGMKVKITDTHDYSDSWNVSGHMDYLLGKIVDVGRINYEIYWEMHYFRVDEWCIYSGMIDYIFDSQSNKVLYQCVGMGE